MLLTVFLAAVLVIAVLVEVRVAGGKPRVEHGDQVQPLRAARVEAPAAIDFVWQEGLRLIDRQLEMGSSLDDKLSPLIALVFAAIAVLLGQEKALGDVVPILTLELFVVLAYLLLSFRARNFAFAPALPVLVELAERDVPVIETILLGNIEQAYLMNLKALSVKNLYLRWASWAIASAALTGLAAVVRW